MNLRRLSKLVAALKAAPRTGWMLRGVHASIAESIAEHMEEAALLALYIGGKLVECNMLSIEEAYEAAAIAAAHDLAEAIVGDIVKYTAENIGKDLKEQVELKALLQLGNSLPVIMARKYIEGKGRAAVIAKLSEQLATLLQALRYIETGYRDVCEIAESMSNSIIGIIDNNPWLDCIRREIEELVNNSRTLCSIER